MPRWRNLHHFDSVTTISFNDGSKHRDVAKVLKYLDFVYISHSDDSQIFLFAAVGTLTPED